METAAVKRVKANVTLKMGKASFSEEFVTFFYTSGVTLQKALIFISIC
jgi:hypothetical protein